MDTLDILAVIGEGSLFLLPSAIIFYITAKARQTWIRGTLDKSGR